jgi:hypothetical protein
MIYPVPLNGSQILYQRVPPVLASILLFILERMGAWKIQKEEGSDAKFLKMLPVQQRDAA